MAETSAATTLSVRCEWVARTWLPRREPDRSDCHERHFRQYAEDHRDRRTRRERPRCDGLQRHAAAKDQRIAGTLTDSAEERYETFLGRYPSIAQRVPQWMLASYLGISPGTLSRIRGKSARKTRKA